MARDIFHKVRFLYIPTLPVRGHPQFPWASHSTVSLPPYILKKNNKIFLMSNLSLPSFSLRTLYLVLSLQALVSIFLTRPLYTGSKVELLIRRWNIFSKLRTKVAISNYQLSRRGEMFSRSLKMRPVYTRVTLTLFP